MNDIRCDVSRYSALDSKSEPGMETCSVIPALENSFYRVTQYSPVKVSALARYD